MQHFGTVDILVHYIHRYTLSKFPQTFLVLKCTATVFFSVGIIDVSITCFGNRTHGQPFTSYGRFNVTTIPLSWGQKPNHLESSTLIGRFTFMGLLAITVKIVENWKSDCRHLIFLNDDVWFGKFLKVIKVA